MAVFRVERNKGYTVMSNHHLRNKDLSLKAKLCKKMNIALSVSSEPGQGTTVTMVFPTESYLKEAGL